MTAPRCWCRLATRARSRRRSNASRATRACGASWAKRPASTAWRAIPTSACSTGWKRSTARWRVASRLGARLQIVPRALLARFAGRRERPGGPRSILIAHHLLLGDTLMLTPLLAKLRERHPQARIAMTVRRTYAPLYAAHPYGVEPVVFDPRDAATLDPLFAPGGFDLACVPGDNQIGERRVGEKGKISVGPVHLKKKKK